MPLSRELPISLLLHALVVTAFVVLGGAVSRPAPDVRRILHVRLASLPEQQAQETTRRSEPAPEPERAAAKPPEPVELEPKTLPKEPRQVERREEPKPKPVVKPQPTESKTAEAADADTAAATGARVATAVDFPFVYYVDLIERRVSRNWHPPPLDSYRGRTRACLVQFVVGRGGEITRVSLAASSGVSFFDREAVAAVKSASPLPPLPAKFGGGELPVTIRFTLKPGF